MKRWHFILLFIAGCAMSFSYGHSVQPDIQPVVQKIVVNGCTAMLAEKPGHMPKQIKMSELRP